MNTLHGIRLTATSALLDHVCVMLRRRSSDAHQPLSILDLPIELRFQIYELSLHRIPVRAKAADKRQCTFFVDPISDPPPFFSCVHAKDRRTAISLLLTCKKVNTEMNTLLFSSRNFVFLHLSAAWKLRAAIGAMKFKFLRNIEICGGWGDSDDALSVTSLRRLVTTLPQLQSLKLLWFERGTKKLHGGRQTTYWSSNQLKIMLVILLANKNLQRVFQRNRNKQVRFCSANIRNSHMVCFPTRPN